MGERKGVNKYYPPDYDPSKGGLNKWQGTHALRERASKLHLGILVIRFEMPYNIWCDGCGNHIGTGVRYNAEKKKVGMYYTTPIYEFRMKCHLCDNYFDIRTDPANLDYEIRSGARRQERRWDPSENEQVAPEDKAVGRKMAADAMFRLEHGQDDKSKAASLQPVIRDLSNLQQSRWEDDFSANQLLRQRFRATENIIKAQEKRDAQHNIDVPLLPPSVEDARQATILSNALRKPEEAAAEKLKLLDCQSVFAKMKPKRVSPAVKKDIAKQSIHNIIAVGTCNFDTFKNSIDKQLVRSLVKKRKRSSDVGIIDTKAMHNTINNQACAECSKCSCTCRSSSSCSSSSSSSSRTSNSNIAGHSSSNSEVGNFHSMSSPYSDECVMSPSSDNLSISEPVSPNLLTDGNSYNSSNKLGSLRNQPISSTTPKKSPKLKTVLPSIAFGNGKEVLKFVSAVTELQSHPIKEVVPSEGSSTETNTNILASISGLLVDYSGSDSD